MTGEMVVCFLCLPIVLALLSESHMQSFTKKLPACVCKSVSQKLNSALVQTLQVLQSASNCILNILNVKCNSCPLGSHQ